MPDRDWYDNHLRPCWRHAARRIAAGASDLEVGDIGLKALARTVRRAGGVPGLAEMDDVLHDRAAGESTPQALSRLRQISLNVGGRELTRLAESAASSAIAAIDRGDAMGDLSQEVYCRFIERAFEDFLFAPVRQRLIGRRFATMQGAHDWQQQCIKSMSTRIEKLAGEIMRHPDGTGLRAPKRAVRRQTIVDLLFQPVR